MLLVSAEAQSPAWPQWRGPARDGLASGFEVPSAWPAKLTQKWVATVGVGHSSPVVAGNRVVIHSRDGQREIVSAFDLQTGSRIWQSSYDAPYQMNPAAQAHGPGPKSTPAIAGTRVITLGISGVLSAFDLESGKVLWRVPASGAIPEYGTGTSPIVDGERVIVYLGGPNKGSLTAVDLATGAVRWRWTGDGPAYASPVVADLGGTRQLVTQSQNRVIGIAVADGGLLWSHPLRTSFDQNVVTPLVASGLVISAGLETPTVALRVTREGGAWRVAEAWRNEQVSMYMSSPVAVDHALFGLSHRNRGQLFAIDLATGKTLWTTRGREGDNASIARAGGVLLVSTTNAELIIARAATTAFQEIARYTIAESATWAHPAFAGRLIVVKDVDKVICWSL